MELTIKINCNNAAFEEYPFEIIRILKKLAEKIEDNNTFQEIEISDINGNHVGNATFTIS